MSLNPVRYCVVARIADKTVVASYFHGPDSGRLTAYEASVKKVLQAARIDERPKLSITDRELGTIHYDSDAECVYMVVTSSEYPQRTAFMMLAEFKDTFKATYQGQVGTAAENGLNKLASKRFFPDICTKYSDLKNVDKIHAVMDQVDKTKDKMQENITKIIENQQNLETLQDKTETMRGEAQV
jgi:hypothetical protein